MTFVRHRHIDGGEHHKNVGLQHDDQNVKNQPTERQNTTENRTRKPGGRPHPQQQKNDLAGINVAVEPQ